MSFLFSSGKPARQDSPPPTADTALRVQTSVNGAVIPFFHGQNRLSGNLLWTAGFAATPQYSQSTGSGGGGGKGGGGGNNVAPQISGYTYSTNLLFGIAEGPIAEVLIAWNSKTPQSLSSINATTFEGTQGQATWSFLSSNYPQQAINYSSLGTVGMDPLQLGSNSSLPNLNWEARDAISCAVTEITTIGGTHAYVATYFNLSSCVVEYVTIPGLAPYQVQATDPTAANSIPVVVGTVNGAALPGSISAGVVYAGTLTPLTLVAGSPGTGQYSVTSGGLYTFASGDAGKSVIIIDFAQSPGVNYCYQPTGTFVKGSNTITGVSSMTGVSDGEMLIASGFASPGTVIQSFVGSTITMNQPALANGSATLTIIGQPFSQVLTSSFPTSAGQFAVSVQPGSYGKYLFAAADAGQKVIIIDVVDADPTASLVDTLTNPRYGAGFPSANIGDLTLAQSYFYAQGLFISPVFSASQPVNTYLQDYSTGLNGEFVWSSGLLTFVPYGDLSLTGNGHTYTPATTAQYSVGDDDYLKNTGSTSYGSSPFTSDDPVICYRKRPSDALNDVKVEYLDRGHSYNPQIAEAPNDAEIQVFGSRPADSKTLHFFTSNTIALTSAQLQLGRQQVKNVYSFTLPWYFILLDPMDCIEITDAVLGLNQQLVRILEISENQQDWSLTFAAEEVLVGSGQTPAYGSQPKNGLLPNLNIDPGNAVPPVIFEVPVELSNSSGLAIGVATGGGSNWGGCDIWVASSATGTYQYVGTLRGGSRVGASTADFPTGTDPDTTHTLSVSLSDVSGSLSSGTQADADQANTLCYIAGYAVPVAPMLSSTAGGSLPATTYYARATYVFASGEGPPSAEDSLAVSGSNLLVAASPDATTGATGWNIYVGTSAGDETKQNASPIAIGTAWTEPTSGLITGTATPPSESGYELVAYETATLTSPNNYNLGTYIRRGLYGTSITDHPSGSQFARLDKSITQFPIAVSQIGQVIYIKLLSFNLYGGGKQALSDVQPYAHLIEGPPLPAQVQNFSVQQVGDTVVFGWTDLPVYALSLKGYDLLYGPQGGTVGGAFLITEASRSTETTTAAVPPGSWTMYIRARDIADQVGPVSTQNLTVAANQITVIYQNEEDPAWLGLSSGTSSGFYRHYTGVLVPMGTLAASSYSNFDEFNTWCPDPVATAIYEGAEIDLGFTDQVRLYASPLTFNVGPGVTGTASVTMQQDSWPNGGVDPNTWINAISAQLTAEFIRVRIVEVPGATPVYISAFAPTVDKSPNNQSSGGTLVVPAGGLAITFPTPYHFLPAVTVGAVGAVAWYTSLTKTGFILHVGPDTTHDNGGTGSWSSTGV